jgi:malonyl-CoA/methylmalonyl-CoA synthetase
VLSNALGDLARFKHPKRYVEIESLPRNSMGKVQKSLLRESHTDLYA